MFSEITRQQFRRFQYLVFRLYHFRCHLHLLRMLQTIR
jgi:hypothetical protein